MFPIKTVLYQVVGKLDVTKSNKELVIMLTFLILRGDLRGLAFNLIKHESFLCLMAEWDV